ncbi:uncharacterized protein LOC142336796 isoform X2 [Convolutriloba macropyga]|uniref:uncharacterized protein LOC142336796 isoform X2 n=1 Tax=Convolutriloba macropyga TaxID=536237 RepID=UPI003F51CE37
MTLSHQFLSKQKPIEIIRKTISLLLLRLESAMNKLKLAFILSVCFECRGAGGNIKVDHDTLQFTLPDTIDENGVKCSKFSQFYCLNGYFINSKKPFRNIQPSDLRMVKAVLKTENFWDKINWFDFREKSNSCCEAQLMQYEMYARKSVSPYMYFEKLTNFNCSEKSLNRVKARFSEELCMNVITLVGYGTGNIRISGDYKNNTDFLLVQRMPLENFANDLRVYRVASQNLAKDFNFNFFRNNFICKAQPWMCENN